jgi:hypothetical protein
MFCCSNIPGINNYIQRQPSSGIYLADACSFDGHQVEYIFGAPKDWFIQMLLAIKYWLD